MSARDLGAIALALAAHVALLAVASVLPMVNPLTLAIEETSLEVTFIEVEPQVPNEAAAVIDRPRVIDEPETRSRAETARDEAPTLDAPKDPRLAAVDPDPARTPEPLVPEPTTGPASPEPGSGLPQPGAPDEYGGPPSDAAPALPGLQQPIWAGLPGILNLGTGPAAPTHAPSAPEVDPEVANRVLSATTRARDKAVGVAMPSTQVVVGAVTAATRAVPVPHNTRATFEVRLGPGGKVAGARVLKSSGGDAQAWEAAAKSVAASLASQKLGMGDADKSGATVIVDVTTKHVYPSGTAKAANIKVQCANQIINDLIDATDKKSGPTVDPNVPVFLDENGKPCIPIGVGGSADLANIGANKQVVVQSSAKVIVAGQKDLPVEIQPVNTAAPWVDTGKSNPKPVMPHKLRKYERKREKKK